MVGVSMREQHGINVRHAMAQHLGPQIWAGINQNSCIVVLQECSGA
jgi:hypothetical protein